MARPVQDIAADIASVTRLVESGQLASEAGRQTLASLAEELTAATRAAGELRAEAPVLELRPEPPAAPQPPLPAAGPAVRSAGPLGWALTAAGCVSVWFVVATAITGGAMIGLVWFGTVGGREVVEAFSPFGAGLAQLGGFAAAQRFVNWRRARVGAAPIRWMFWLGVVAAILVFYEDAQHSAVVPAGGTGDTHGLSVGERGGGPREAPAPSGEEGGMDRPPGTLSLAAFDDARAGRLTRTELEVWSAVYDAEACEGANEEVAKAVAWKVVTGPGPAERWRVAVTPDERAAAADGLVARSVRCGYTQEVAEAMVAARLRYGSPLLLPFEQAR